MVKAGDLSGIARIPALCRWNANEEPDAQDRDYRMEKAWSVESVDDPDYLSAVSYENTTYGGIGAEYNREVESDPWAWQAGDGLLYTQDKAVALSQGSPALWIKTQMPTGGKYIPTVECAPAADGGTVRVALHAYDPVTDTVGVELAAGEVDAGAGTRQRIGDEALNLPAGEYVFRVEAAMGAASLKALGLDRFLPTLYIQAKEYVTATIGEASPVPLQLTRSDGAVVDSRSVSVSFLYEDEGIVAAAADQSAEGVTLLFTGLAAGTTKVTAEIRDGEISAKATFSVLVDDGRQKDIFYDLLKGFSRLSPVDYLENNLKDYAKTTNGSATELNPKYITTPWAYHSADLAEKGYFKYNYEHYGLALYKAGMGYLKIQVPTAGVYLPEIYLHCIQDSSANVKAYLMEYVSDQEVGEVLAQTDEVVTGAASLKRWVPLGNRPVTLQKGEYILALQNTSAEDLVGFFDAFRLNAVKLAPETPKSIRVGERVNLAAYPGIVISSDVQAGWRGYPDCYRSRGLGDEHRHRDRRFRRRDPLDRCGHRRAGGRLFDSDSGN